ncbi:MAG: 6,7-dimethyl-8-ribityllumazine synthase [Pseudobdellovibrio sp.]
MKTQKKQSKKLSAKQPLKVAKKQKVLKIGVVTSRFNEEITSKLEEGTLAFLESLDHVDIFAVRVPGAVEIPLAAQALLEYQKVDAVITLGAVIRGETTHYEEVCRSVERNCSRLMLDYKKPVAFGVLTTENEEQALDRVGGKHGHKGVDAAQAALEMIGLLAELKKK